MTVNDILEHKGRALHAVAPEDTVFDAIRTMSERHVGALLVMANGRLVGILTERDYARKVILMGRASKETAVHEIMTRQVYYVRPEDSVDTCMALMTDRRIRHLPVLLDDDVIGIVSIGDLVRAKIDDLVFAVRSLENYITGQYPA